MGLKKNKDRKRGIIWLGPIARAKLLLQPETYALELKIVVNLQVEANIANAARKVVPRMQGKQNVVQRKKKRNCIGNLC